MRKMKSISGISGLAMLGAALLSGCAGYPMGPSGPVAEPARAAAPLSHYTLSHYTGGRYSRILHDQYVIADRRGNGPVTVAPQCGQAERRAAVKAEWEQARRAPGNAPLPSSDPDGE